MFKEQVLELDDFFGEDNYYGLKNVPASHATLYELFWPLSAMFIDWFFRSRTLELAQIIGAILLLGSTILLTRDHND